MNTEYTHNDLLCMAFMGFSHFENTLTWTQSPVGVAMTKATKPYFFERLNEVLQKLDFDCSAVKNVTMDNYQSYLSEYTALHELFENKYGDIAQDALIDCMEHTFDKCAEFVDYLGLNSM